MSGKITHSWNGTVLTVTSDAGTSSADLKGNTGCRGPQGPHGVIYDGQGNVVLDGFATEEYVNNKVDNIDLDGYATEIFVDAAIDAALQNINVDVDLDDYATKVYVSTEIAKAQLEGAGVDTSGFATKDDMVKVDGSTITQAANGVISTAIGGGVVKNEALSHIETGYALENFTKNFSDNISLEDASIDDILTVVVEYDGGLEQRLTVKIVGNDSGNVASSEATLISSTGVPYADGIGQFAVGTTSYFRVYPYTDNTAYSKVIVKSVAVYFGYTVEKEYVPIKADFIPVDNSSIVINDGKLTATGVSGGSIDLTDYATKEYVDEAVANVASGGTVDLSNYATKAFVNSKITYGTADLTDGTSELSPGVLYCVIEG